MRELTSHKTNPCNEALTIKVLDEPGQGGACHAYEITGFDPTTNASAEIANVALGDSVTILFQNGPIAERGVNGITNEALLAIVADRLECFQRGAYANDYNDEALFNVNEAMMALHRRTIDRMNRGVEGTHEK